MRPPAPEGPQRAPLADGRWHFGWGPIDLVIGADGQGPALATAHADAWARFGTILPELVAELPRLRAPVGEACPVRGVIAQRMWQACRPYRSGFITPMAAVAGAVAEEVLACYRRTGIRRAWIDNGGDIALHLAPGESVRIGLFGDLARFDGSAASIAAGIDADFRVDASMPVRGIATSGWRGRSFSLGIADSVTVLAWTAAQADAAATVIANAVDVADPRIVRQAACELKDDSDLGEIAVTIEVPALEAPLVQAALQAGLARAHSLRAAGLIEAAVLVCQRQVAVAAGPAGQLLSARFAPETMAARTPAASAPCADALSVGELWPEPRTAAG